jgi:hypothetical protein
MNEPQYTTDELIRIAAQRVINDQAAGRFVDAQRLAWAKGVLAAVPENKPVQQPAAERTT